MWMLDKEERQGVNFKYIWNNSDFNAVDPTKTDYLLGICVDKYKIIKYIL